MSYWRCSKSTEVQSFPTLDVAAMIIPFASPQKHSVWIREPIISLLIFKQPLSPPCLLSPSPLAHLQGYILNKCPKMFVDTSRHVYVHPTRRRPSNGILSILYLLVPLSFIKISWSIAIQWYIYYLQANATKNKSSGCSKKFTNPIHQRNKRTSRLNRITHFGPSFSP